MTHGFNMSKKLRVAVENLSSGVQRLSPEATHYVCRVHRLAYGAELMLFEAARGVEAEAVLGRSEGGGALVEVGALREAALLGMRWLTLVQSLGKGEKVERIVREATTLGVGRLILVESQHSVATAQRAASKQQRWRRIVTEALRQCGRGDEMQLVGPTALALPLEPAEAALRWVLHPSDRALPLLDALEQLHSGPSRSGSVAPVQLQLWVGPEGGFSDEELAGLQRRGASLVCLGPLIQRMETAATVAAGVIGVWANARGCWRTGPFAPSLVR